MADQGWRLAAIELRLYLASLVRSIVQFDEAGIMTYPHLEMGGG
jgi:hypothetical protein